VLIEKQKTTPEYYPMTIAGITTGCNQKSNRDPVTNYDPDDVEDTLQGLRKKGATVLVEGLGRTDKWKHNLYEWFNLKSRPVEMAVLAELMLRGPQTEGELRGRAARMAEIPDLPALQAVLEYLTAHDLTLYLSPPGQRRGVVVTHNLYPAEELARVRQVFAQRVESQADELPAAIRSVEATRAADHPAWTAEVAALRSELSTLRETVARIDSEIQALKTSLGV
jgi:uncharacterized protein YceH (UPF0502 family)